MPPSIRAHHHHHHHHQHSVSVPSPLVLLPCHDSELYPLHRPRPPWRNPCAQARCDTRTHLGLFLLASHPGLGLRRDAGEGGVVGIGQFIKRHGGRSRVTRCQCRQLDHHLIRPRQRGLRVRGLSVGICCTWERERQPGRSLRTARWRPAGRREGCSGWGAHQPGGGETQAVWLRYRVRDDQRGRRRGRRLRGNGAKRAVLPCRRRRRR